MEQPQARNGHRERSGPAGASVQTPYTCVDYTYPTFRFFGRNNRLLSTLAVSIVYKEPLVGPSVRHRRWRSASRP
jgi:hypothetical protein